MRINWNNIRAIEGQRDGFEELVCQLAGQERIDHQKHFTRIGKPDGGKECYWELSNGNIHCWQAKYFLRSLSPGQWTEVDESVEKAINNHPNLETYYVSIPIDRPDGKGRGTSMLEKWKKHVAKWESYASSKGMKISFEYWGKYELETRLRKKENEGLIYYFFNEAELTDLWFDRKNQESIDALGGRYTPELNFDLPFLSFYDSLVRDPSMVNQIDTYLEAIIEKRSQSHIGERKTGLENEIDNLDKSIGNLRESVRHLDFSGAQPIPFDSLKQDLENVNKATKEILDQFHEWRDKEAKEKEDKGERVDHYLRPYHNEVAELEALRDAVKELFLFLSSGVCKLVNRPYLLLIGRAGIGKSHTLADIVSERKSRNQTSLLLLGENFSTSEMPWTQILRNHLRFSGDEDTFLGALNSKAESQQSRIIILIDALNEGKGKYVWPRKLRPFIRSFHRFPWLGLIVSIRDSFESLIAPDTDIDDSIASRVHHPGFEGSEFEASLHFFNYYEINPPGSPLLHPEFQNPLFLKLFCEGLNKRGLRQMPDGYQGISAIIENYLEGIEENLSRPGALDYDRKLRLLRRSVDELILKMVEEREDHLEYPIAHEIAKRVFGGQCGSEDKQYLRRLISEGVINEDRYWNWKDAKYYEVVHFAYQRFQDHLTVSMMLDRHLDLSDPEGSFRSSPLWDLLKNETEAQFNQHLIEALSVQVAELVGKELHEIVPFAAHYDATAIAFINGLPWRRSDTLGKAAAEYVHKVLRKKEELFSVFLNISLSMATKTDFFFNADWLHAYLYKQSLAERDELWTIWLQDKYGPHSGYNSVKRLIDWAWSPDPKAEVNDEALRLAGVTLSWFLTSSNRYLRDSATTALVSLFQERIALFVEILQKFEGISDPYVYERLYAVAYGCALRTRSHHSLVGLSNYIYNTVFDTEFVYPHILLRDYARGVIEYTLYLGMRPNVRVERIRPPYKSNFPKRLPTNKEIDTKYRKRGEDGHYSIEEWGTTAILNSMTTEYGKGEGGGYGDFGRYTFQSAMNNWAVDYDGLSNYVVEQIFQMGYDPKVFSVFDANQGSGRGTGHLERIGKKYQWIGFHRALAIVSDNCKMFDEESHSWSNIKNFANYDGPWRPYVRDFDPSIIIRSTQKIRPFEKLDSLPWWSPYQFENWNEEEANWIMHSDDFPPVTDLLTATDANGVAWLNLQIHLDWREAIQLQMDRWNERGKRLSCEIGSFLVKRSNLRKILHFYQDKKGGRRFYQRISNRYEVLSLEHYWSPASLFFQGNEYYGGDARPTTINHPKSGKQIAKMFSTAMYFLWEEEFDCSKEEPISYYKPSPLLASGLKPSQREGEYLNDRDEMVCFDPSVYQKGPPCLLVRKDHIQKFLKESDLTLVWIVQGQKQLPINESSHRSKSDHALGGVFHLDTKGIIRGEIQSRK